MGHANGNSLMYDVIERMDYMLRVMDEESNIIYMNQKMKQQFGDFTGRKCYELLSSDGKCINCISECCRRSYNAQAKDVHIGDRIYRIIASPVSIAKKERFSVEIFEDVTEQTRILEENLKNYEKLKEDLEFAKQIQNRALPLDDEYWGSLRLASSYRPSEALGGDIFDLVRVDEKRSLFYIADVSGHGVRASLLTIFLRQIIRGLKVEAGDLANIVNELLMNYNDLNMGNEQYFSVLIGLYDKSDNKVTFLNAGHNCLPLILGRDGSRQEIMVMGMPICELVKKANHKQVSIRAEKGDRILFYTDGITEAYNREKKQSFGLQGMLEVIDQNPQAEGSRLVNEITSRAEKFADCKGMDDMAAVLIEIL